MWVALKQIVKVGSTQLKGYNNIFSYGIGSRMHVTLMQQTFRSTQPETAKQVILNPETQDTPYILTKDQQDYIAHGVDGGIQKLNALSLELYVKREKGHKLPERISLNDLKIMLNITPSRRKSFLRHLCAHEKSNNARMVEQLTKERPKWIPSTSEHPWLDNRVHENCLFLRVQKQEQKKIYNSNAYNGLLFGQKVIIDCSYNAHMDEIELKKTALQILKCYYSSRTNRRPFALHLCNLDFDSRLMFYLQALNSGFGTNVPIGLHSKSYLELFEREKLVYLTPHSNSVLKYNPNDTYIIGGFVDNTNPAKLSGKKASQENIRHASLPLDKYLKWRKGAKTLCINHCFDILLDVKNTGDWAKALQTHVPSRRVS